MRKSILLAFAGILAIAVSACTTTEQRTVGGAALGGLAGAAVGSAVSGGSRTGTLTGAAIGATGGALVGAASSPERRYYRNCPYGYYRDRYGNTYCR